MESLLKSLDSIPVKIETQLSAFLFCLLISLVFGILLSILYKIYYQDNEPQDGSLARSLVLLVPSLMSIFWLVQHSLALSIGLLGSLSFVRFRTPVKRAEDVAFVVIALSTAIACAVEQYLIVSALLVVFFLFSYGRKIYIKYIDSGEKFAILTFNTRKTSNLEEIDAIVRSSCKDPEFISSRTYDGITSFVFNMPMLKSTAHQALTAALAAYDANAHINVFYPNDRIGV